MEQLVWLQYIGNTTDEESMNKIFFVAIVTSYITTPRFLYYSTQICYES